MSVIFVVIIVIIIIIINIIIIIIIIIINTNITIINYIRDRLGIFFREGSKASKAS